MESHNTEHILGMSLTVHSSDKGVNQISKTILVAGGAGFIGSNFIYYLLRNHPDYRIACVDCLTYAGNLSTLETAMRIPVFHFYRADICNRTAIYEIFEEMRPDFVINFAAESHVDRSIENPEVFLKTNVLGTQVLMDACRKFGIKRFHQVSTDEVYGDLPIDRPDILFTEETPIHTSSPYSASKASADLLALAYHRTYELPVSISRCSNNYGPYHFPEKLIPLMIINALSDKELPVYGQGLNVRDWLYVEDHCSAIDLIIHKGHAGEVYNIGGHNEMKNIDIVRLICSELNKPEALIKYVTDRKGHDMRYAIDPTKINNELGWLPETTFKVGINKTIEWYLTNKEWWEPIISGEYKNYYTRMYGKK
jgi:dTDP-glucose 4,6-dehydratase